MFILRTLGIIARHPLASDWLASGILYGESCVRPGLFFGVIWRWNEIAPFRVEAHFTPCYIFILNQSHIVSSRHRDIISVPKISLSSQRALNITESTLRTLLYLTFWELADICSNLYRGVIEIQRRRESCKEQENCSEEYSVPHKQKPKQHARTDAGTGTHTLITNEEASKT